MLQASNEPYPDKRLAGWHVKQDRSGRTAVFYVGGIQVRELQGSVGWAIPSLCRATPSATSEHLVELLGSSPIPRSFVASCVSLQLRLLPFRGVTRLHRYNEPLRHPKRPGLSLASCQLIHTAITAGTSRVALGPHCLHAVATTPAGRMEIVRSNDSIRFGLPSTRGGSAPALTVSGSTSSEIEVCIPLGVCSAHILRRASAPRVLIPDL